MTAVGGFFASISSTVIGGFLLRTALSIGASLLIQKLAGNQQSDASFSVRGRMDRGANIPQSFGIGEYATAGTLAYTNTSAGHSPNAALWWVVTLSDIPITGINDVWVNGVKRTLMPAGADGRRAVSGFQTTPGQSSNVPGNHLMVEFFDGTQTAADSVLTSLFGGSSRPWASTAVGKGTAYAVVYAYVSQDFFPNGIPKVLFELTGAPLYDISKDTTAGGSGTHRWNDPTTWESSTCTAVQLYNILRGITYDGEWFYGLQDVTEAQLPAAHWIDQINKCKETVTGDSGAEPRFRSGGEIPVNASAADVITALLTACNGRLSDAGGVYKLHVGVPGSTVMSFTDDDILSTEGQMFTPMFGLADTVNGVSAKYPAPNAAWQVESAPPLYRPDYEAEDGDRRLLVSVDFDLVPYPEQVQRLMKSALNEARRARRHTIALPPKFWALEPGDVIEWTSERNGYVSKQFRVDGVIDTVAADVILDLTEIDPTDYDFNTAVDFTQPAAPSLDVVIPTQDVPGFAVAPVSATDADGNARRPGIQATWSTDIDDDVIALKFQTRVKMTGAAVPTHRCDTPLDGSAVITDGIIPNTQYEVRARYITRTYRPLDWTSWLTVTSPDTRIGSNDLETTIADTIAAAAGVETALTDLTAGFVGNLVDGFADEAEARDLKITSTANILRSEFNSAASFLSVRDFADGSGDWTPADHTIVTSTTPALPAGITHALRMDDQGVQDGGLRVDAGMADRVMEWSGWVLTEDATGDAIIRIRTQRTDGITIDNTDITIRDAGVQGWAQFSVQITLPSDVGQWTPVLRSSVSGTTQNIFWANLDLRDVSGIAAAETSAKAYADQEILALTGPGGAITTVSETLAAEVTSLRGESDGLNVILDDLTKLFENNSTTLSGAAAVGQPDTIIVTEAAGTRVTSGNTNGGAVIEIDEEKARQFSGRRVKISILARAPVSAPSTRFGIAYSTADAGNSGYLQADADLQTSWEWFYFFFGVPTAGNGGPDYLAIFGDDDQNGDGTQVARVNIQIAAEAADLPEIADLQGSVTEIKGLDLDALTGTAFGTFMTQLNVDAGGTSATITSLNSAKSDMDGFASAFSGLTVTTSGGAIAGFKASSWTSPDGTGSLLELMGDVVKVGTMAADRLQVGSFTANLVDSASFAVAGLAVFGNNIAGGGFDGTFSENGENITDAGTVGYAFSKNDAVLNRLIVRNSIVDGAVSDRQDVFTFYPTHSITFPPIATNDATVFVFGLDEEVTADNTGQTTVAIRVRYFRNGQWTSYETVGGNNSIATPSIFYPLRVAGVVAARADLIQFQINHTHQYPGNFYQQNQYFEVWGVTR
ncbi:phage tail protein [Sedimentitalea sp. JM2-8]|uniref:Phage tail protein n=1 Tax=Sedimentitalea xiamensis TaxID=3050037 RepID=A0ABT7FJE7_9RHOB|nr:phage tail protein [Sedimentitalea xiamensis]